MHMITTGQMRRIDWKKYHEMLETMPDPTEAPDAPRIKVDLRGALAYARQKGVDTADLTDAEKQMFMTSY